MYIGFIFVEIENEILFNVLYLNGYPSLVIIIGFYYYSSVKVVGNRNDKTNNTHIY